MNEHVETYLMAKAIIEHSVETSGPQDSCRYCYAVGDFSDNIDHDKSCAVLIARKYVGN